MSKTYSIPISNGLLEHYATIGDAIWLLLHYIDKTTKEVPDEKRPGHYLGLVHGSAPYHDVDAASALRVHINTIRTWRARLTTKNYIEAKRTPNGYQIRVVNSQKWQGLAAAKNRQEQEPPKSDTQRTVSHKNSESQNTGSHTNTDSEPHETGLDPLQLGLDPHETATAIKTTQETTQKKTQRQDSKRENQTSRTQDSKPKAAGKETIREVQASAFRIVNDTPAIADVKTLLSDYQQQELQDAFQRYAEPLDEWDKKQSIKKFFKDGGAHGVILSLRQDRESRRKLDEAAQEAIAAAQKKNAAEREAQWVRMRAEDEIAERLKDNPFGDSAVSA